MIDVLKSFNENHSNLFEANRKSLYRHFYIAKKKGGLRPIDQPCDELQLALLELKDILAEKLGILHHTAAFAYVTGRSTAQSAYKHQANKSNWYLKTDFSGFFPNTTIDFAMEMMSKIFPASEICKVEEGKAELRKALSLGFLNGGLPQGTKLSPWLTNAIMIPLDHELFNYFAHKRMVYTRYADDICISCVQRFDPKETVKQMESVLKKYGAPWQIKPEKTQFLTNKASTSNWILGCNLNKDNNITVGWENKKLFKTMTTNIIMDYKHGNTWPIEDVQHYRGLMSYYMMIEKEYFTKLVKHFEEKFHVKMDDVFKASMSA
jgi:RNA-directed DNA polymerase